MFMGVVLVVVALGPPNSNYPSPHPNSTATNLHPNYFTITNLNPFFVNKYSWLNFIWFLDLFKNII